MSEGWEDGVVVSGRSMRRDGKVSVCVGLGMGRNKFLVWVGDG